MHEVGDHFGLGAPGVHLLGGEEEEGKAVPACMQVNSSQTSLPPPRKKVHQVTSSERRGLTSVAAGRHRQLFVY